MSECDNCVFRWYLVCVSMLGYVCMYVSVYVSMIVCLYVCGWMISYACEPVFSFHV